MPKLNNLKAVYQYLYILRERESKILNVCNQRIDKSNFKKVRLSYYLIIKLRMRIEVIKKFLEQNDPSLKIKLDFKSGGVELIQDRPCDVYAKFVRKAK